MRYHWPAIVLLAALASCKPPETDGSVERIALEDARLGPSAPIASPDTEGAIWAESDRDGRIIYGQPGQVPLMALACEQQGRAAVIHITRFATADPEAKALIALIGNGHAARLPVSAMWTGRSWLWEGFYPAGDPNLEVLTGPRRIEVTIPGAGSVILNSSQRPARLIDRCRRLAQPRSQPAQ